jgi:pimeloyl-ACP methyl ester carboxylesterase
MMWRVWNADRPALPAPVLLHGGSGAWNHWVRNILSLEQYFRVIAADLPGYGESSDPPRPYDAKILAWILSNGLDLALPNHQPFHLVSFSFGGILSGLVAHAQAWRIRSLTLVGAPVLGLTGTGPANNLVDVPRDLSPAEAAHLTIFSTAISFYLLQFGSIRLPAAKVMAYTFLIPAFVLLQETALGDPWPSLSICAGVLVIASAMAMLQLGTAAGSAARK